VVLVALGLWVATSVSGARSDLSSAATTAEVLGDAVVDGDQRAASRALEALQESTASAEQRTSGVLWRAAGTIPFVGDDFDAVAVAASAADDIARHALPPVVQVTTEIDLESFSPRKGTIDLARLATLAKPVARTDAVLARADARLRGIDTSSLLEAVRGPVGSLQDKVARGHSAIGAVRATLSLLPGMLGGDTRHYLVMLQNNAEVRSTGGIPGSVVLVEAGGGHLEISRQGGGADLGTFDDPVVDLTKEERALYDTKLARFFNDSNLTPEFPRTAQIARAMVDDRTGVQVDGVFSVDVVAASYVLDGTGPVTVDGERLTASNAVDVLLNQAYLEREDPDEQDDYFEDVARELFEAFVSGRGDTRRTIEGLVRAGREGRLYAWSSHDDEQAVLARTPLGGTLAEEDDAPTLGIYLNDSTGAKMQYYLRTRARVVGGACRDDGSRDLRTTVDLRSDAPVDAADLPESVVGPGFGTDPGAMRMNLRLYLPAGTTVGAATVDDIELPTATVAHRGQRVLTVPVRLAPGQRARLVVQARTAAGTGDVDVHMTPGSRAGAPVTHTPARCAGS
jgi:hypothetical protein